MSGRIGWAGCPGGVVALVLALGVAGCGDAPDRREPPRSTDPGADAGRGGLRPLPPVRVGSLRISSVVMPAPVTPERTALYLSVSNDGPDADTLLAVDVGGWGRASLHRTSVSGGVARMRPSGPVAVAPGETVDFRPGGLHGMVEDLSRAPTAGDTVTVTLRFGRGGSVEVRALVVPYAAVLEVLGPGG